MSSCSPFKVIVALKGYYQLYNNNNTIIVNENPSPPAWVHLDKQHVNECIHLLF